MQRTRRRRARRHLIAERVQGLEHELKKGAEVLRRGRGDEDVRVPVRNGARKRKTKRGALSASCVDTRERESERGSEERKREHRRCE